MQSPTRQKLRRGFLPALLATIFLSPLLAGCGEDRSNLIPQETSRSLIAKLDQVQALAAEGDCFGAAEVAAEAQQEIEALTDIDPRLKRSLVIGVVDLQLFAGDAEKCEQSGTDTTEEPVETEEVPEETEGTTGATGTTDGEQTTGAQGNTNDDDQDSGQPRNNGNQPQGPPPAQNPENPTNPTPPPANPTTPANPGSGGLGPG